MLSLCIFNAFHPHRSIKSKSLLAFFGSGVAPGVGVLGAAWGRQDMLGGSD